MRIVYLLEYNSDTTEGRGPMVLEGIFDDPTDAEIVGKSSSNFDMGGHPLYSITNAVVFDTVKEYRDYKNEELRQRAFSKLTSAEKRVLGF
jgi:hypothetical protein